MAAKLTGTFAYDVSVYVEMENGQVTTVRLDDCGPIQNNARMVEPDVDATQLAAMIAAADDGQAWPSWEIGL